MLPCLAIDPISERLEANTNCLHSVVDKMNGLPPKVSDAVTSALSTPLTSCCDSLNSLVNNVAKQVQDLVSCVDSLKGALTSNANTNNSVGAVSASLGDASHAGSSHSRVYRQSMHPSWLANRSENLILFALVFLKSHCWLLSLTLMKSSSISLADLSRFWMGSV